MKTTIVQLGDLLKELGKEETIKILSEFTCPKNPDVEQFLTQDTKAIRFEETGNARTYLILNDDTGVILAYFSISFKELLLADKNLSKTTVYRMDGISKRSERIRAFLIGQIGKNAAIEDNLINLNIILDEVYAVISAAKALIGGRIIILECEDSPSLIKLYEQHGFKLIEEYDPNLRTMYIHVTE